MNINVLNKNLERIGIVMQFTSLIWVRRYVKSGDCELYLPATMEMINLLQKGFYLTRDDDDMVCVIRKIEITTDEEQGNMLIVTGIDVRCLIDQRIQQVPGKFTNALAESSIRSMVTWAVINAGADGDVNVMYKPNGSKLVAVKDNSATLTNRITTEYGYGNAGNKIREVQAAFEWGGRMYLDNTNPVNPILMYETYKGSDRRSTVKFSPEFHTLKTSDYVDDVTPLKNATYIATKYTYTDIATGENTMQICIYYGTAAGTNRFEQISQKNPATMTKAQVEAQFPGGSWQTAGGKKLYTITGWSFVVPPGGMRAWIEAQFPGVYTFTTSAGVTTATTEYTVTIAETSATTLASDTSCNVTPIPMMLYFMGLAKEGQATKTEKITFTADIIPDLTYKYKEDYFLGDLVTIENEFGISAVARVSEVLESWDNTGYNLEIKFNE